MRLFLLGILLGFFPLFSHAQFSPVNFTSNSLSVELEPNLPSPQEEFTATLNDYSGGAFGATIEWYYNDAKLDWAVNRRSISLTAPDAGQTSEVRVVLQKPDGSTQVLRRTVSPLYLDIIIEPQTHVPIFYKGRALPSAGSSVVATALVSGDTTLTSSTYLYTWRLNDTVIQGGPLRGGSRVSFEMPQDSFSVLSVTVTTLDGNIIAQRSLSVPTVAPRLLFYEVSTLYGLLDTTLRSPLQFIANSMTIRATPYYLDSEIFNNPDVVTWSINTIPAQTGSNPYDITLEKTGNNNQTELFFRVQSTTKFLQVAKESLILDVI